MQVVYGGGKQCVISKQDRARSVSVKSLTKPNLLCALAGIEFWKSVAELPVHPLEC